VLASEYAKRAFELRDRVTEREKLALEVQQTSYITGDLIKDEQIVELWKHTYPREVEAFKDAAADKMSRGDFYGSLEDPQKAVQLNRSDDIAVGNLAQAYAALNRLDDAKAVLDQGLANGIDPAAAVGSYYSLAFLCNDVNTMQKQLASWRPGSTGIGASASGKRRCGKGPHRVSGFLRPLERRRPRHPHPEASQGGIRKVAVADSVSAHTTL
jgi:tetratricopeptide (TPR) repeat protein